METTHSVLGVVFLVLAGVIAKVVMGARLTRLQAGLVALQRRQRECQTELIDVTTQYQSAQNTLAFHQRRIGELQEEIAQKHKELAECKVGSGEGEGGEVLVQDLLKAVTSRSNPYWEVEHEHGTLFERSAALAVLPVADGYEENFMLADVLANQLIANRFFVVDRAQITHEPKVNSRPKLMEKLAREEYDKLEELLDIPLLVIVRGRGDESRVTMAECKVLDVPRGLVFCRMAYQPPLKEGQSKAKPQGVQHTAKAMVRGIEMLVR